MPAAEAKPIVWMGSSRETLRAFPNEVRRDIGQALYAAQQGETDPAAKAMKGFGGTRVMEIVDRHATGAYRAVYTAHFAGRIYVLHAFQTKSTKGIATPPKDIDIIRQRCAAAQRHYEERRDWQ
jgi:phage-related protein